MVKYALKIFEKNLQLMLDISTEFENVKKHSKDVKIYVIIMYTQKN